MKLKYLLVAGGLMALGACTDSDYELSKIVPEEYHKILYVNNSGKQALTLYDTGNDHQYTFSIIKAGSDPTLTAHATIGVMPQTQIDEEYSIPEGVNYSLIDEDCYSLETTEVDFNSTDRYKLVNVFFKTSQVKEVMENNPDKVWVLPLLVTSSTDSINAKKNEVFIELEAVLAPMVGFVMETPVEIIQIDYSSLATFTAKLPFGLNVNNTWDLECSFGVNKAYVDEYNRSNGTLFSLFPDESYTLPETMRLANGVTMDDLEVEIAGNTLLPGDYMLPVSITGISMFAVSETNSVYPLMYRIMGTQLDRTGWTAEATSEETTGEGTGNGVASCILDDNLATYWHSSWQVMAYPPFEIIIDMQAEHTVSQIALLQRCNGYTDTATGRFSISSDKNDWTEIGQFSMENGLEKAQIFGVNAVKGRYLKIRIETSHRSGYASLSEVYVYGVE
jgi:hypothetical protein